MKPKRVYVDYLHDIQDAVEKALQFTAGMDYDVFVADEKTVYAVIRALEIVGEATKKIAQPVRDQYPELPWRAMAGIRDKLIHEYFGVNLEVVWRTVQEDVPSLRAAIRQVLVQVETSTGQPNGLTPEK